VWHPLPVQATRAALGTGRPEPGRRLHCAVHCRHAALLPPTAAALCRAAFAGGPFPSHAFERSRVIASPSCPSPPCSLPRSRTNADRLRSVVIDRVFLATRTVFAAHLLIGIVVFGTEAHGACSALVHRTLRSALGFHSAFRRRRGAASGPKGRRSPTLVSAEIGARGAAVRGGPVVTRSSRARASLTASSLPLNA
jgi:hypothetical protein